MSDQWQGLQAGCTGRSPKAVALLSSGRTCHLDHDRDHTDDPDDGGYYDGDDCITSLSLVTFVLKTGKGNIAFTLYKI